jgi:putative phosphoesterase
MRLALVSDIHGNLPALEAVVKDITRRGVDAVINLGDSLSGPLMPLETAQFLMAQDWVHLAGNHERQLLSAHTMNASDAFAYSQLSAKEWTWLALLPSCAPLNSDVMLCHGTPRSDVEYFMETVEPTQLRVATQTEIQQRLGDVRAGLIACGHTHLPRMMRSSLGQLIINPGSVGLQAYDDTHPYPHKVENGSPDARYAIVEQGKGSWSGSLIAIPYKFKAMAKLAQARQRPEWAKALLTGYI